MSRGVILVSHTKEIPEGLQRLIGEVAKNVPITTAGGLEDADWHFHGTHYPKPLRKSPRRELMAFMI